MIVIIDYGVGNLSSIKNMLRKCGFESEVSSDPAVVASASHLILPGVGSFDHGIANLRAAPYFEVLSDKVLVQRTPFLGVCLGAQLLADSSEEGVLPGLGWIKGRVVRFDKEKMAKSNLKVPHMGWAEVQKKKNSPVFNDMYPDPRFYFVHSYHWVCDDISSELVSATYGYEFTAGVEQGNILGVQFHPEKSHKYGMRLYENFIRNY